MARKKAEPKTVAAKTPAKRGRPRGPRVPSDYVPMETALCRVVKIEAIISPSDDAAVSFALSELRNVGAAEVMYDSVVSGSFDLNSAILEKRRQNGE